MRPRSPARPLVTRHLKNSKHGSTALGRKTRTHERDSLLRMRMSLPHRTRSVTTTGKKRRLEPTLRKRSPTSTRRKQQATKPHNRSLTSASHLMKPFNRNLARKPLHNYALTALHKPFKTPS